MVDAVAGESSLDLRVRVNLGGVNGTSYSSSSAESHAHRQDIASSHSTPHTDASHKFSSKFHSGETPYFNDYIADHFDDGLNSGSNTQNALLTSIRSPCTPDIASY